MKTLFTIITTLIFTVSLLAQNYAVVSTTKIDKDFSPSSSKGAATTSPLSELTLEIYGITHFEYRTFLKETENSKKRYRIGTEVYTKKQLTKIFRKGTRRSENVKEFEEFLIEINSSFLQNLSERETADIFTKFRKGTLHAYLDGLPEVVF